MAHGLPERWRHGCGGEQGSWSRVAHHARLAERKLKPDSKGGLLRVLHLFFAAASLSGTLWLWDA